MGTVDDLVEILDVLFEALDFGLEVVDFFVDFGDFEGVLVDGMDLEGVGCFQLVVALFNLGDGVFEEFVLLFDMFDDFDELIQRVDGDAVFLFEVGEKFIFFFVVGVDLLD